MTQHLERELDKLKKKILSLGVVVEEAVSKAVRAASERDARLAQEVVGGDRGVDEAEVDIEEECLKLLALHQPVAIDLRFIIAVLKMNNDLERIGDLAVNIANRAESLAKAEPVRLPFNLNNMAEKVKTMLGQSLKALVTFDADLARSVCAADDEVDEFNRQLHREVTSRIKEDSQHADTHIMILSVSRNLERIADHATNIAEDVVYMVGGEIVRHGRAGKIY